jgi:mRNA interferase MazF
MTEGDVVLTSILQADGSMKNRPAILLREMPPFKDFLVCGISTQLRHQVENFDSLIAFGDPDFKTSGLTRDSLIRLGYLAVLPRKQILGVIGSISPARHRALLERLSKHLMD